MAKLVIKSLGLSKLLYFLMNIPRPPDEKLKEINSVLYRFVWNNRKDKIKREILIKPYKDGGIGMIDVRQFDKALKLTWMKRFLSNDKQM